MKVIVDLDLCQANGVCTALSPTVFAFDDDLELHVLTDEVPADAEQDTVEAVQQCPRSAIFLK